MSDQPRKNIEAMRRMGTAGFAPPIAQLIGMRAVAFATSTCMILRGEMAGGR